MTAPEFTRPVRLHDIGSSVRHEALTASAAECAALAARFDLLTLGRFDAALDVHRSAGAIHVSGTVRACGEQACVISAEPVAFDLTETVALRFSDGAVVADAEIELTTDALDDLPVEGDVLDLGEIAAQSLGLGLDPYPRASDAARAAAERYLTSEAEAEARAAADKAAANPFGKLRR